MIYYLPIEEMGMRYSTSMNEQVEKFLERTKMPHTIVQPVMDIKEPPEGCFLHASQTCNFKSRQLEYVTRLYKDGIMKDGDIIFCADLWFPGIEMIPYMNHFHDVDVKVRGFMHAGSWTDTDEVRKFEYWAHQFENMIFSFVDKVYVGTKFAKEELTTRRLIDKRRVVVTPLPLDYDLMDKYSGHLEKQNIIVFNGRHHPEKQPHLFKELKDKFNNDWQWIDTHEHSFNKEQYYELLSSAKIVVSFALQENFGIGILEAAYLGCTPLVPDRLAYKELFPQRLRYKSLFDLEWKLNVCFSMEHYDKSFPIDFVFSTESTFRKWFKAL